MRPELVVGAGAALLIGALAGMEWWAEHHWSAADAIVRPAAAGSPFGEIPDPGVPETREGEEPEASASPRLIR